MLPWRSWEVAPMAGCPMGGGWLQGREEQEEVGLVFSFFLFEDSLQDEEEILEAWLPIAARCCSMVDMGGF